MLNNLVEKIEQLYNVSKSLPPEGIPFPKISGPMPEDDVCIVGAGPAGIHMAHSLDEIGYKRLRIFESTERVGGKS